MIRIFGGTLFLVGSLIGIFNIFKTIASGTLVAEEQDQAVPRMDQHEGGHATTWFRHRSLEAKPILFTVLVLVAIIIGGVVEFFPTALIDSNIPKIASVKPYSPLELEGRDIYIREGCYNCHSQMVRPFRSETERYGEYSKAGEFVYDHPFQWGSKRTGPDLHRVGGKYPDSWHYLHMKDPYSTSPNSIMPAYTWMYTNDLDVSQTAAKIKALRTIGVPYPEGFENQAVDNLKAQAEQIAAKLRADGFADARSESEIIAIIAYLQRLGTDIKGPKTASVNLGSTQAGSQP
jgi:cytochrome c oxidase cbb3-type subunit I/II